MNSDFQSAVKSFIIFLHLNQTIYSEDEKASHEHVGENYLPEHSGTFLDKVSQDQLNMHNTFIKSKSMDTGKVKAVLLKAIETMVDIEIFIKLRVERTPLSFRHWAMEVLWQESRKQLFCFLKIR